MSEKKVEVVRKTFEAWNAGDMDALRELFHPNAVMRVASNWPERGPFVGRDAVMRQFEQVRDPFDQDSADL